MPYRGREGQNLNSFFCSLPLSHAMVPNSLVSIDIKLTDFPFLD